MGKLIDLTGHRFGHLTVLQKDNTSSKSKWWCRCDCGNMKSLKSENLRKGWVTSCGCQWKTGRRAKEILPGTRFGKLTVIKSLGVKPYYYGDGDVISRQMVLVQCDCGNVKEVGVSALPHLRTCGCSGRGRRPAKDDPFLKS